jgi:hypothetical protein
MAAVQVIRAVINVVRNTRMDGIPCYATMEISIQNRPSSFMMNFKFDAGGLSFTHRNLLLD